MPGRADGEDKAGGPAGGFKNVEERLLYKFGSLQGRFGKYHVQVDTNRQFYDLDFAAKVFPDGNDEDIWPLIPPAARWAVDEASDHILIHPKIKVPVRPSDNDSQEYQQSAENKRKFLNSWWSHVSTKFNPIGDGRKILINEGRICVRKSLRLEMLPDLPSKPTAAQRKKYKKALKEALKDEFMWDVQLLDNKTVFEDPSNHRDPQYVYVAYKILKEEAERIFPNGKGGEWRTLDDYSEVEYKEYWSKPVKDEPGKFIQWIEDESVHSGVNPYPYIPILIEDAGFGTYHSTSTIEEKYVGMTQHVHPVFIAEARQMTAWEAVTELTAFPIMLARNMPDRTIHVGPKQIINLDGAENDPNAESLSVMEMPEIPLGVIQLVAKTTEIANNALKMQTLGGTPLPGVETATEADQQIRNASSKLSAPIAGLERLVQRMNEQVFMDITDVIESPVTLYGSGNDSPAEVTLTTKDIGRFYRTNVGFTTSDEDAISQVKARFWAEMYRVIPFLSAYTAMERGDIADDPTMEMIRRSGEDVFLGPEMLAIRTLTAGQAFGELAQAVKSVQEGGGEVPTGPAAGEGADSANALVSQDSIVSPTEERVVGQSLIERDTNQRPSQFRA
jgi:hypothetical protein